MLLQTKKFAKLEYYWLNDFNFRKMLKNWKMLAGERKKYVDLHCLDEEFYEFKQGLMDRKFSPPSKWYDNYEIRKINYDFGWKLGLEGKISSILSQKEWVNITTRIEAEKLRETLNIDPDFPLGYFFEGLEGNLYIQNYRKFSNPLPKDHILANLAGYDFFLQRKESAQ